MSDSRNRPLFNSIAQYELVVGVVREYPRREGEGFFAYLDRIAVAAALLKPGDGLMGKQKLSDAKVAEAVAPEEVKA